MSTMFDREFISQIIIIVAVCVGGWMMIIEPQITELKELEATIAEVGTDPSPTGQDTIQQMADRMQTVRSRLSEITTQNRFARDSSRMYGVIMDLAEEHKVVVRQMAPDSGPGIVGTDGHVQATALGLTVQGEYEQIAMFLSELDALSGYLRPVSLNVTPRHEEASRFAEATFSCEVVQFTLPKTLAAIVGGDDANE